MKMNLPKNQKFTIFRFLDFSVKFIVRRIIYL